MKKLFLSALLATVFVACDRPIPPLQSTDPQDSKQEEPATEEAPPLIDYSVTTDDEAITQKLRAKLINQNFPSASQIKIITHDGIVTLRGNVETIQEKNRVERSALRIKDVKAIENLLEVQKNP